MAKGVYKIGDVMYDSVLFNIKTSEQKYSLKDCVKGFNFINIQNLEYKIIEYILPNRYYLATVHRAENTDDLSRLEDIINALEALNMPVVFPVHPRTLKGIKKCIRYSSKNIVLIGPLGYLQTLILIKNSLKVITDSGGLQKEAFFLSKPCVTLRNHTEWVETLRGNWNILAGHCKEKIIYSVYDNSTIEEEKDNQSFGEGKAVDRTIEILDNYTMN